MYDDMIERHIAAARELRARYHAELARRAWAEIKRLFAKLGARAQRRLTHAH